MVSNILIDGKWYLLLFRKMAKFLVEESTYDVYFASYDKPLEKVTTINFKELDKQVKHYEDIHTVGDCFLLELELPSLEVKYNSYYNKFSINSSKMEYNTLYGKIVNND